jgi:hypothetical protein
LLSSLLDEAAHSSLRSVPDVYTQAPAPAQQEAERAVLSLVFLVQLTGDYRDGDAVVGWSPKNPNTNS